MTYTVPRSQTDATSQPKFTDAQYRDKCFSITGTRCLHRLKQWCEERQISKANWIDLTRDVLESILNPHEKTSYQADCCIQKEILAQSKQSERICKALRIDVEEIAPMYAPLVPPSGSGSHQVRIDGQDIVIFQYGQEFHTTKTPAYGCSDPYSAALMFVAPMRIEAGKAIVHKRQAATAKSMQSGRFANAPAPNYN
jgi:hypothetical protein